MVLVSSQYQFFDCPLKMTKIVLALGLVNTIFILLNIVSFMLKKQQHAVGHNDLPVIV